MRKWILVLLFLLSFTMASCGTERTIKIGFVNSLSYNFGNLGIDSMYGAMYAVEEINQNGGIDGKKLELIIRDDERNADTAVVRDNELKSLDVIAIIGHGYSLTASSIATNALENDILMITPTIATEEVSNIDDTFFRVSPTTKEQGEALAILADQVGTNDVVILYESVNSAFSQNFSDAFQSTYEELGHTINPDNVFAFEHDTIEDLIVVKNFLEANEVKNVVAIGSSYDVGNIVQLLDNPEEYTFFLPAWTTTSDIFDFASGKIDGSYSINFYDFENPNSALSDFRIRYLQDFGLEPSYSTILAYEAVYLLKDALEYTDDYSTEGLKSAILEMQEYEGIMDDYYINEYGECMRRVYFYELNDSIFETIGYYDYD